MIHTVPKPELSPDFTMEDIRKIREWNAEQLKDATPDEVSAFYAQSTKEFTAKMEALRKTKVG